MRVADGEPKAGQARARGRSPAVNPGKHGRLPSQVLSSARSPSGNSSRAFGMMRSNCTGDGAASRAANSTPVVMRMPCSIGVIT